MVDIFEMDIVYLLEVTLLVYECWMHHLYSLHNGWLKY